MSFLYIEYRQLYRYTWIKEIRYDTESDDRRFKSLYFSEQFSNSIYSKKKRKKRKISIENLGQFDNKIIKIIVNEGMPHTNRFPEFKTT